MTKSVVPFWARPGYWGLKGKAYDRARAEYELEGEALDRRLLEIDFEGDELADKLLDVDLKYHRRDQFEVDCVREKADEDQSGLKLLRIELRHSRGNPYTLQKKIAELTHDDENERKLALLKVERAYDKIDDSEYDKQVATIHNEPWIGIVDHGFDPSDGVNGLFMEFDWNDQWIGFLRAHGYTGFSEDEIVEKWFQDINHAAASAEDIDVGYNFVESSPRSTNRIDRGNGTSDYH